MVLFFAVKLKDLFEKGRDYPKKAQWRIGPLVKAKYGKQLVLLSSVLFEMGG